MQAGVEIARLFLPSGVNVAYTEGRVVAGGVKGDTDYNTTVGQTAAKNEGGFFGKSSLGANSRRRSSSPFRPRRRPLPRRSPSSCW